MMLLRITINFFAKLLMSIACQVSRAQVLKQASEYIHFMSKKNGAIQQDIEDIKRQNNALESQSKTAL
jgi:hypothetical protein